MRPATRGLIGMAVVLALGAVGCAKVASRDSGGDGGRIDHPTGPRELVLRVALGGGLLPLEYRLAEIAGFSLFGDGRVVTTGPQIEIYPGPALPSLLVKVIDERGVQAILQAAREAGLEGSGRRYEATTTADAATTTFVVVAGGYRHVTTVYALHEEGQDDARRRLQEFDRRLGNLEEWLPAGSVGEENPFEFDALRVYVMPDFPGGGEELSQPEKEWPLATPLASFGQPVEGTDGARCGVVSGALLNELRPMAEDANLLTPWRSGEDLYHLVFRPLLPDESGCA